MKLELWEKIRSLTDLFGNPIISDAFSVSFRQGDYGAKLSLRRSGSLYSCDFFLSNNLHRCHTDGPAHEVFYSNGKTYIQQYSLYGLRHRPINAGPAIESFTADGKRIGAFYWVNGERIEFGDQRL
jgi:hypothetical protein